MVRATGRWDGRALAVSRFDVQPEVPFGGKVSRVILEGYLTARTRTGRLSIAGFRASLTSRDTQLDGQLKRQLGTRVVIEATVSPQGNLVVERAWPRGALRASSTTRAGTGKKSEAASSDKAQTTATSAPPSPLSPRPRWPIKRRQRQ
jgi:hypothetical protein